MLLTNSNCLAGPTDFKALTYTPLNRRSVRECVPDGAKMLPPKLYLVVFYQVSLVNWTGLTCSDFREPSVLLPGSFVVSYHMFIPHGGVVINVIAR